MVIDRSISKIPCLKLKFLDTMIADYCSKLSNFGGKSCNSEKNENVQHFINVVMWRHFSGVVYKCTITNVKCLQDSVYQKLLKSVHFWLTDWHTHARTHARARALIIRLPPSTTIHSIFFVQFTCLTPFLLTLARSSLVFLLVLDPLLQTI